MNKNLIIGLSLSVIVLAGLLWWFSTTRAEDSQVQELQVKLEATNAGLLEEKVVSDVKKLDRNGQIPVEYEGKYSANINPF